MTPKFGTPGRDGGVSNSTFRAQWSSLDAVRV